MDNVYRKLHEFECLVPLPGYEIVEYNGERLLSLQGGEASGALYEHQAFSMFDKAPDLFKEFAFMDLTPEGVLVFANKYGSIGLDNKRLYERETYQKEHIVSLDNHFYFWEDHKRRKGLRTTLCEAEKLDPWYNEAQLLRLCLMLWDKLSNKVDFPSKDFRFVDGKLEIKMPFTSPNIDAFGDFLFRSFGEDIDYTESAITSDQRLLIETEEKLVNDGSSTSLFYSAISFIEMLINNNLTLTTPHAALVIHREAVPYVKQLEVSIRPMNLLAAMWLQFAQSLDGRQKLNVCKHCGAWFDIGKWGSRRDRKYCSNKCRQAAYGERKKHE